MAHFSFTLTHPFDSSGAVYLFLQSSSKGLQSISKITHVVIVLLFGSQLAVASQAFELSWERRLKPLEAAEVPWLPLSANEPELPREYRGTIEYRARFSAPARTENTLGIYIGQVGDVDRVYLNGRLIGQTGDFPPNYSPYLDLFREYAIPPDALRLDARNELRIEAYVEYVGKKGISPERVVIGSHSELQRAKYLAELVWYLSRTGIPILCVFLSFISMPWLASREQIRPNLLLLLTAIFYAIFGVGKSRVLFHFFEPLFTYKLITLSALFGLIFVFVYALDLCRLRRRWPYWVAIVVPLIFAARIFFGQNFGDTALYVKDWLIGSIPLLVWVSALTWWRAKNESIWVRLGIVFLAIVATNDVLNATRVLKTVNLMDYGFLGFIVAMMVSQMTRTKRGWVDLSRRESDLLWSNRFLKEASQLAHDIRSPLSSMVPKLTELKESVGAGGDKETSAAIEVLEAGLHRMQAMATRVLSDFKKKFSDVPQEEITPRLTLIDKVIEDVVIEVISTAPSNIHFDRRGLSDVPKLWSVVEVSELQAAIANILRNAIEACATVTSPCVSIELDSNKDRVVLTISDNGFGIPAALLPRIFEEGFTFGKSGGTGLGLTQAKKAIELNDGTLELTTEEGHGTKIRISFPIEAEPSWLCKELKFVPSTKIIFVDDDPSLLAHWRSRLAGVDTSDVSISYFSTFGAIRREDIRNALIVSDNDVKGESFSGIEWLKRHRDYEGAVLCTSDYDDPKVQQDVRGLKIQMIPKPQMRAVQLSLS